MLTFSEALTLLKLGEDMRYKDWPAGHFIRLTADTVQTGMAAQPYQPTQAEMLGCKWERA
jgi:hypothetical protein